MKMDDLIEEMNHRGAASMGKVLTDAEINFFINDLTNKKKAEINELGIETLLKNMSLETITDLGRYENEYYDLIAKSNINDAINILLNDKAVIHSFNAIILDKSEKSNMVGHGFHRDMPWFKDTRTSVIVMIPLVDYSEINGSTKFVPGSHMHQSMPSLNYMEKYEVSTKGKAGEAFIVDSTTWHRAGDNNSGKPRPMIVIKYTLAPFKQQIEFYISNKNLEKSNPIVKQRLGWNVQVPHSYLENQDWNQETRKFKSGQYDMTNTQIR